MTAPSHAALQEPCTSEYLITATIYANQASRKPSCKKRKLKLGDIVMSIWGKPDQYPTDIDTATVRDIARFIKKSCRFPLSIQL